MAKVPFTAGRIADFECPAGKAQAFLWDSTAPGLGLRVTPTGSRAYVFQSEFEGRTLRMTIGSPDAWAIKAAQEEARRLQTTIDAGRDPRVVKAERTAADVAARAALRRKGVTVGEAWAVYVADRTPHWGERHIADHERLARAGGATPKRGVKDAKDKGILTTPGPLHALMTVPLSALDADAVTAWAKREAAKRPTQARLALRLLQSFLTWCGEHKEYKGAVDAGNAAKNKRAREFLGEPAVKKDALMREQLPGWFKAIRALPNPAHAAYLQTLLLCGCRPSEMLQVRWDDVDTQWHALTIRDKVEGERTIPLTPYVESLLTALPRRPGSPWVFSSPVLKGRIMDVPDDQHRKASLAAGISGLTLHGLRRSFKSLTEWLEVPVGVVAQIQGHKPSATAEKHYTVRPLDLLRVHHERIEEWILAEAGIACSAHSTQRGAPISTTSFKVVGGTSM
jgi:integrase